MLALIMALGMLCSTAQGQQAPAPSAPAGIPQPPACPPAAKANLPTICQGGVAVLSFTPSCDATSGYTCTWTPAANSFPINSTQIAVNPLATTTYTCTATPASGPVLTLTVTVTVQANCCMTSMVPKIVLLDDEYGNILSASSPQCPSGCFTIKPDPFVNQPPGTYFRVTSGNSLHLIDASFTIPPGCVLLMAPGKDVVVDDAYLNMQGATITAECDQMWGKLLLPSDSHLLQTGPASQGTMRSRIMHAQGGITVEVTPPNGSPGPAAPSQASFRLDKTDFLHNYVSLSLDRSVKAAGTADHVTNCAFDSDPDAMKGPYQANGSTRTYTYAHLRVAGNLAPAPINNNSFDHAVFHVLLTASSGSSVASPQPAPYLVLDKCTFANFYVAGIFQDDHVQAQPDFNRPLTVTNCTFAFFKELAAPGTPQIANARSAQAAFLRPGVAGISSTFMPVTVQSSTFVQNDTGPYATFAYAKYRTEQSGIDARWLRNVKPPTNTSPPNVFRALHYGIRYQLPANDLDAELKGNLFAECEKGVDFVNEINNATPANISTAGTAWLDCNTFTRGVSPAARPGKSYGIYVEKNAAAYVDDPSTSPLRQVNFLRNLFDVNGVTGSDFEALHNDNGAFPLNYRTYNDYASVYSPTFVGSNAVITTGPSLTPVNSNPGNECAPDYIGTGIPRPARPTDNRDGNAIEQNTPNPTAESTVFRYHVAAATREAELLIRRAVDGYAVGHIPLNVSASMQEADLHLYAAGVYFYTLMVDGVPVSTRRLVIR